MSHLIQSILSGIDTSVKISLGRRLRTSEVISFFFSFMSNLVSKALFGDSQVFSDLQWALTRPLLMHESFP